MTPDELKQFPPTLVDGAFLIDNSNFEYILSCERAAFFRTVAKREWSGSTSALSFGRAIHKGLELRYKRGGFAHESLADQQSAVLAALGDDPCEPGDWRTPELAADAIHKYAFNYPVEPFEIVTVDGRPMVELPFAVELGEVQLPSPIQLFSRCSSTGVVTLQECSTVPVVWTGKIDLIIRHTGDIWISDHKTTSIFGDTYFHQYELASQFHGYSWVVQKTLGVRVRGVLINVLAIRKPAASGKGKGTTYHRKFIDLQPYLIEEWQVNTLTLLAEFFSALNESYFPMRTNACVNRYGRKCSYHGVCSLPQNQRMMYLMSGDFREATWSPLDED